MNVTITTFLCAVFLLLNSLRAFGQYPQGKPSKADAIQQGYHQKVQLEAESQLKHYPVRSIGPVVQGARITDIAVADNPKTFYIAYASGGVYKTRDAGISFQPIFDDQGALTIGDLALAPSADSVLYVGTGEKNSSRSSYAGSGIYKSSDAGNSWQQLGLAGTQHISRIVVHPNNPDIVWVAAMGALYSHNPERGVYKSTNGGQSWEQTLFLNDSTGIIDLVINPENPEVLYAAAWERERKAWNFKGNGPASGIYKSTDGGESWEKLSAFPEGAHLGRIGLSIADSQPNTIYALLDNQQETKKAKEVAEGELSVARFATMSREELLALDDEEFTAFLKEAGYPEKYTAKKVKEEVREGKYEPKALAEYFGDANEALFDTEVAGAEVYRSDDAGGSWKKVNEYPLEGVYYTYGYYFGEIRVSPSDADKVFILGVPMLSSKDGGKHWYRVDTTGEVHVDHQTLWINPKDPEHLLLGNDGGLYISQDGGAHWRHVNNMAVGQFYTVNVDMEKPYNVYGGLQDNGVLMGSSKSIPNKTDRWKRIMGGDGMYVAPDPRDNNTVYTGFQFGNYYRLNLKEDSSERITPQHDLGEPPLRFNWRTPLMISQHHPDILYLASQKVHRSLNQGESWEAISPDLTKNLPQGNVPYSTIVSLTESPLKFGLLYAGTDDGNIQRSRNGGASWELVSETLPDSLWVSSLQASRHKEGRVYATLTGYRFDDFRPYLYRSEDYGNSWQSLQANLPEEAVNVLIEDPQNPALLYAGTDQGSYVSLDGGNSWQSLNKIPNAAAYDMIVHPRENELVVGTHGRSVWVADVKPLQAVSGNTDRLHIVQPNAIRYNERWGEARFPYLEPTVPSVELLYYVPEQLKAEALVLKVEDASGALRYQETLTAGASGFQRWQWNLKANRKPGKRKGKSVNAAPHFLSKGEYTITLKAEGAAAVSTQLIVK